MWLHPGGMLCIAVLPQCGWIYISRSFGSGREGFYRVLGIFSDIFSPDFVIHWGVILKMVALSESQVFRIKDPVREWIIYYLILYDHLVSPGIFAHLYFTIFFIHLGQLLQPTEANLYVVFLEDPPPPGDCIYIYKTELFVCMFVCMYVCLFICSLITKDPLHAQEN